MKNSSSVSPRSLAVKIIEKTLSGTKAQEAFDHYIEKSGLSRQDRQFCADLIYGCLRMRVRLDFILSHFLKNPEKLPGGVRHLLALGLYSLLFQDKIPAYAAVNETVSEIKKLYGQTLSKVANGVLRNIQKLGSKPLEADWYIERAGDEIKGYSLFYAMPEPIVRLWLDSYGKEDCLRLLERSSKRPWQGVRVNPLHEKAGELYSLLEKAEGGEKIGAYGFAFPPGQTLEALAERPLSDWINEGALSLQSPGSMLIMEELGLPELEGPVWDCCAGSGIKTAALMERGVDISLATDLSLKRLKNIKPFCGRLRLKIPPAAQASATMPPLKRWGGSIMADVPCSGLGTLARRPDIRENAVNDDFWRGHAAEQEKIMESLAGLIEPGKKLVYITCTLNPHENELLIQNALARNPGLFLEKEWQTPNDHPWLEGMYGAVLSKKSAV